MGLLDDEEFLKKKRKPNLLANVQQLQRPAEPYLRQQYPEVYGGLGGLLGMAPDEMAGSILDPNTARVRAGAQIGFPIGTAAQVIPMARPAQAAAMAAGRAGERFAERAVPQIMERGGMGAEMLQGMSRGTVSPLDVYHGSPHKYDKFDASKIGTGEGAQAYGHGIYTAENPGIAQGYADRLGGGQFGSTSAAKGSTADRLSAMFDNDGSNFKKGSRDISTIAKNLAEKTRVDADGLVHHQFKDGSEWIGSPSGWDVASTEKYFYKVDLPDEQIAKMLDWDKPFSEQVPNVQAALKSIVESEYTPKLAQSLNVLSKNPLSHSLGTLNDQLGGQHITATYLQQAGIPGIKYLDNTSRGAGTGTRNFVTFPGEEQSMTILERNGQPMVARPQQQDAAPDLLQYQQMLDEEERKKLGGLLFR